MLTENKHFDRSEIVLSPGEEIQYSEWKEWTKNRRLSYEGSLLYAKRCPMNTSAITYDNEYRITEERLPEDRKLSDVKNCDVKREKYKLTWRYTYTFTDEDYEYAKKFGENLYEIE